MTDRTDIAITLASTFRYGKGVSTTATAVYPDGRTLEKTWHGRGAYERALLWRDAQWWGQPATEYRNEDGEITFDEAEADGWTDAGLEVDSRGPDDAEWTPWNYEAGYDYENNRYHDEARA